MYVIMFLHSLTWFFGNTQLKRFTIKMHISRQIYLTYSQNMLIYSIRNENRIVNDLKKYLNDHFPKWSIKRETEP